MSRNKYDRTVLRHPVRHNGNASEVGYVVTPGWPDDMVALLKRELLAGHSAGQISVTINGSGRWPKNKKSRSAVIGKIDRLGLAGTKGSPPKETNGKRAKQTTWTLLLDELIVKLYDEGRGLRPGMIADHLAVGHNVQVSHQAVRFRLVDLHVFRVDGEIISHPSRHRGGHRPTGTIVDIIEANPKTSVHSHQTEAGQCQWPTSRDVRDMHVCGEKAVCGAYCERHGMLAYRKPPTPRRVAAFHKVDSDWARGLKALEQIN